jgi:ferredoxin
MDENGNEAEGGDGTDEDEDAGAGGDGDAEPEPRTVPLTVRADDYETTLAVKRGSNLRTTLLDHGFDVYGSVSRVVNCGGRGLCGTCGVRFEGEAPDPEHWHDRAAARWGYPRLSCQLSIDRGMRVELVEKVMWGGLAPQRSVSRHEQS